MRVISRGKPLFIHRPVQRLYPLEVCVKEREME